VGKPVAPRRRGGRAKWVVLAALALGGVVAVEAGWGGFGLGQLPPAGVPRGEGLPRRVPGDTGAIPRVRPPLLDPTTPAAEGHPARARLEATRDDVKKATGIDLFFDVDKLVLSPSLAVARGRFDGKKLRERLAEHRYAPAEHKGVSYLVRAGEDAIAVVDDS